MCNRSSASALITIGVCAGLPGHYCGQDRHGNPMGLHGMHSAAQVPGGTLQQISLEPAAGLTKWD